MSEEANDKTDSQASEKSASSSKPSGPAPTPVPQSSGGSGRGVAWLAVLLALASIGVSAYLYWLNQQAERARQEIPDVASMVNELESTVAQSQADAMAELEQAIDQLGARIDRELETLGNDLNATERLHAEDLKVVRSRLDTLERRFDVVEGSVSALARNRADAGEGVKRAEAEFMLRLAGQRLDLFEDREGAVRALELGLDLVRALNDPVYASVRQTIEQEIADLQSIEEPDRSAIAGRLRGLADQVLEWPFNPLQSTTRPTDNMLTPEEDDPDWLAKARSVLSDVITVQGPAAEINLMTLSEQRVVRENLKLTMEIARLAAIRPDGDLYASSIQTITEKTRRYFVVEDERVAYALRVLEELEQEPVAVDYPTLGKALRQLRNLSAAVDLSEEEADP